MERMGKWMNRWVMVFGLVLSMLIPGMAHAVGYKGIAIGDSRENVAKLVKMERMAGNDPYLDMYPAWKVSAKDPILGIYNDPILLFDKDDRLVAITFFIEGAEVGAMQRDLSDRFVSFMNMVGANSRMVIMGDDGGEIVLAKQNNNDMFMAFTNHQMSIFLAGFWAAVIASDYEESKSAQK